MSENAPDTESHPREGGNQGDHRSPLCLTERGVRCPLRERSAGRSFQMIVGVEPQRRSWAVVAFALFVVMP